MRAAVRSIGRTWHAIVGRVWAPRTRAAGTRALPALLATAAALIAAAPASAVAPVVQAHRGGSYVDGTPRFPENTMPAFRRSVREGYVLEFDVKLTADDVPVVIHDADPARTTTCDGPRLVRERTLEELQSCKADVLGSPGSGLPTRRVKRPHVRIPTLRRVLRLARERGARVNVEIKNYPNEGDFDPTPHFANRVMDAVIASRLATGQVMIQSFYPPNLEVAEDRLPPAETSLLTLREMNEGGPAFARGRRFADRRGYEWVSPNWPPSPAYVSEAHALGLRVVPYTLNTRADVRDAARASVDELITDDPAMARRAVRSFRTPHPPIPPPPSAADCRGASAHRTAPTIESYRPEPRAPRVFAMQFKQEIRHVVSYASFRTKIECMIRQRVEPRLAAGRPNVVAFNEDVGLMTIATGTRGRPARQAFGAPRSPSCEPEAPCATLGALAAVTAAYSKENAAYRARFGPETPVSDAFVAATDTFARGWMQVFSDMARRYDVYILGSNNQAAFRESSDPVEIETFRDPDLPRPESVHVATSDEVYNEVFMWGPRDVRPEGPQVLRNVVATNKKVPLTEIEQQIQLTPGPSTGPDGIENVRPYRLPGTAARISFATSLPAFVYGDPPPGTHPCSDTSRYYMRCLDRLGANLVMQDEANPGRWAGDGGGGYWQPLEWMRSTWRAASDPTVEFDYNVTPHMVGNLADLPFDGQTAITQRGLGAGDPDAERCTYIGNRFHPAKDPESARDDAGPKREFLAIAPWVVPGGPREHLREVGEKLAPSSNQPLENDYVETAIAADLPFPPEPNRPGCATAQVRTGDPPGRNDDDTGDPEAPDRPPTIGTGAGGEPTGGVGGLGRSGTGGDPAEPAGGRGEGAAARAADELAANAGGGQLPFTGLALAAVVFAGLALLGSGLAVSRAARHGRRR